MKRMIVTSAMMAILLNGCTMIPDYERPSLPVSEQWPTGEAYGLPLLATQESAASIKWQAFFQSQEMQKIIQTVLDNNKDIKIAALQIEQARAAYRIERAALLPSILASGSMSRTGMPANASAEKISMISSSYTANIGSTAFEIDLFGRIRSLNEQALEQFFATEEAQKATRISLIAETANACLTYLTNKKLLSITEATLKSQQETLNIIKQRKELGLGTQLDVEQAHTALQNAKSSRARYLRLMAQSSNALQLLMGKLSTTSMLEALTLDSVKVAENLPVGLPSAVLLNRPDIQQAEHTLKAANANIGVARAAFFPVISLTSSAGFASTNLVDLFKSGSTLAWTFAPQVTLPIFQSGKSMANLESAEAGQKIAAAQYEKALQVAFREVADQLAARGTYTEQLSAQKAATTSADNAFKLSRARYENGTDSYLTMLIAQRDLYNAQETEANIQQERLSNSVMLYKTLGGGLQ